ncbi:hypothetical protein NDU88_001182 [Pleurodeles waltl]|uniref:Uncharacterized protein n=1 Tax=Pleurodeles waltl TaxID=8319 RepID=A0AAV7TH30_PLEWA|nr:hypothetical protein NDU88_001182 [Pleurodeles waltl]
METGPRSKGAGAEKQWCDSGLPDCTPRPGGTIGAPQEAPVWARCAPTPPFLVVTGGPGSVVPAPGGANRWRPRRAE